MRFTERYFLSHKPPFASVSYLSLTKIILPLSDIGLTYLEVNLAFSSFSNRSKITERGVLALFLLLAGTKVCLTLIVAVFKLNWFSVVVSSY